MTCIRDSITGTLLAFVATLAPASSHAQDQNPALHRTYEEAQTLTYHMTGTNEAWHYTVEAKGTVKKGENGAFYEDFAWSDMKTDGRPEVLSINMASYNQRLSLDPVQFPGAPNLQGVDPKMVGPVTDMMTFYVDYWLAAKFNRLVKPGDHFYFSNPTIPSWADGQRVLVGEDAFDFDMTLLSVDTAKGTAELEVKHVPPPQAEVHLAAAWMQAKVGGQPNNWVQVTKTSEGQYLAGVGQETFDVHLTISLPDGRILRGSMQNPVTTIERLCTDSALTQCGDAKPHNILRTIEIELEP